MSSNAGYYVFPSVRTGVYTLTISSTGFKTTVSSGITVTIGAATAHNFVLQVGAASETVSIDATALALETESSDVAEAIQPEQVDRTSSGSRDISTFIFDT